MTKRTRVALKAVALSMFMPHVWLLLFMIARDEKRPVLEVLDGYQGSNQGTK